MEQMYPNTVLLLLKKKENQMPSHSNCISQCPTVDRILQSEDSYTVHLSFLLMVSLNSLNSVNLH